VIYNPANEELYIADAQGRLPQRPAHRVPGRRRLDECVIACSLPHIGRGDP